MAKKTALSSLIDSSNVEPHRNADKFTSQVSPDKRVRLNINVSEDLLRRIRIAAAEEGTSMAKLLTPILERHFPDH